MANYAVTDLASLKRVSKQLGDRNYSCMQTASAKGLSRAANGVRKAMPAIMKSEINRPVRFTTGRGAVIFEGADAKQPISDQQSTVALGRIQSAYLNPIIVGETLTELYGRKPVIVPHIKNLKRAPVRKALGIKVSVNGNIKDLAETLERIRNNSEFVFEINRQGGRLPPGIYFRNTQRNGRVRGIFTLFSFERSVEREAQFDYSGKAHEVFVDEFPAAFTKSLKECLDKTR